MATAYNIVAGSLGFLHERESEEPIEGEDMADCITVLNEMMAAWEGGGMRLGFTEITNQSDPVTVRTGALLAIKQSLSLEVAPLFDIEPGIRLTTNAMKSYRALRRQVIKVDEKKFPSTMPRGSGNQVFRYDRFYEGKNPAKGLLTLESNSTATTISAAGTPVLVAGTWAVGENNNYTSTTAGRMTYTPQVTSSVKASITASLTIKTAAGDNTIEAYIAKNGVVVFSTSITGTANTTDPATLVLEDTIDMFENDYIELFVANVDTTDNLIVTDGTFWVTE